jgi:hypothetical protein
VGDKYGLAVGHAEPKRNKFVCPLKRVARTREPIVRQRTTARAEATHLSKQVCRFVCSPERTSTLYIGYGIRTLLGFYLPLFIFYPFSAVVSRLLFAPLMLAKA